MKKIALLTCLKSNDVCTRTACLQAVQSRSDYFAPYAAEKLELTGVWTCQGCEPLCWGDELNLAEKLQCLQQAGTQIVHIGCCCRQQGQWCKEIRYLAELLQQRHIQVIWGTHA